jgi:hypothetical protein
LLARVPRATGTLPAASLGDRLILHRCGPSATTAAYSKGIAMRRCDRRPLDLSFRRRAGSILLPVLWMSLIANSSGRAAAISFAPPVSITQTGASGITAADFTSGRLSLLYGRGDGTFEAPVDLHLNNGYQLALGSHHQMIADGHSRSPVAASLAGRQDLLGAMLGGQPVIGTDDAPGTNLPIPMALLHE